MKGGIVERSNSDVKEMRPKPMPLLSKASSAPVNTPSIQSLSCVSKGQFSASYSVIVQDGMGIPPPSENDLILDNMSPAELQDAYAEITSLLSAKNIVFLKAKPLNLLNDDISSANDMHSAIQASHAQDTDHDLATNLLPNSSHEEEMFDMSGMRLWYLEDAVSSIGKHLPGNISIDALTNIVLNFAASDLYQLVNENDKFDTNSIFSMHRLIEMSRAQMKMQSISALSAIEGLLYRRDICCSLVSYHDSIDSLSAEHFLRHNQYQLFLKAASAYNQAIIMLAPLYDDDCNQAAKALSQALLALCCQDIPSDLASLMLLQWRRGTAMRDVNLLTVRLECLCEYLNSTVESAVETLLSSEKNATQQQQLPQAYFILPHVQRPDCSYEEWHNNRLEHLQFIFQSKDEDNNEDSRNNQPRSLQDLAATLPERDKFILRSRWSRLDIISENEDILRILSQVVIFALDAKGTNSTWQRPAMAALKIIKLLITQTLPDKDNNVLLIQIVLQPMLEYVAKITFVDHSKVMVTVLDMIVLTLTASKRFTLFHHIIKQHILALFDRFQCLDDQIFAGVGKQMLQILAFAFLDLNEGAQNTIATICCEKIRRMVSSTSISSSYCCDIIQTLGKCAVKSSSASIQDQIKELVQHVLMSRSSNEEMTNQDNFEIMLLRLCIITNSTILNAANCDLSLLHRMLVNGGNSSSVELLQLQGYSLQYLQLMFLQREQLSSEDSALISQLQLIFEHTYASIESKDTTVIDGLIKRRISQYQQQSLIIIHSFLSAHCLSDSESIVMALQITSKFQGNLGLIAQQHLQRTIMTMYRACFSDRMIRNEMADHTAVVIGALFTSQKMNTWVMSKIEAVDVIFPLHPLWMFRALLGLTQPVFGSWMIILSRSMLTLKQQLSKQMEYEQLYILMKLMRMESSLSWSLDNATDTASSSNSDNSLQKEITLSYASILSNSISNILDHAEYNQTECEEAMNKLFCSENTLTMNMTRDKDLPATEQNKHVKQLKKRQYEGMLSFCQNLLDCSLNQIEVMELQTVAIMTLTLPMMPSAFRRKAWEELGLLKLLHLADDMDVIRVIAPVWIKSLHKQLAIGGVMTAREFAVQEEVWRCLQTLREGSLRQCFAVVNLAMISLSVFVLHELLALPQERQDGNAAVSTCISNPFATALLLQIVFSEKQQRESPLMFLFSYWLARAAAILSSHSIDNHGGWETLAVDCLLQLNAEKHKNSRELLILKQIKAVVTKDRPAFELLIENEASFASLLSLN